MSPQARRACALTTARLQAAKLAEASKQQAEAAAAAAAAAAPPAESPKQPVAAAGAAASPPPPAAAAAGAGAAGASSVVRLNVKSNISGPARPAPGSSLDMGDGHPVWCWGGPFPGLALKSRRPLGRGRAGGRVGGGWG